LYYRLLPDLSDSNPFELLQESKKVKQVNKEEVIILRYMSIKNIAFITDIAIAHFDISNVEMADIYSSIIEEYTKLNIDQVLFFHLHIFNFCHP
jgi:hypothetical protein